MAALEVKAFIDERDDDLDAATEWGLGNFLDHQQCFGRLQAEV